MGGGAWQTGEEMVAYVHIEQTQSNNMYFLDWWMYSNSSIKGAVCRIYRMEQK